MGRKLSSSDAPAALNMFPKLDDVPIRTYLTVLAKMRRPSTPPSARMPRSFSRSTTSTASFTPSPMNATSMPARRWARMTRDFCAGVTRAKTVVEGRRAASSSSSIRSSSSPVIRPSTVSPRAVHACRATRSLSPVMILTPIPKRSRRASDSRALAFTGSVKTRKPASSRPRSSSAVILSRSGAARVATATTRAPASNWVSRAARASAGIDAQRSSSASGAPLAMSRRLPSGISTSTDMRLRS